MSVSGFFKRIFGKQGKAWMWETALLSAGLVTVIFLMGMNSFNRGCEDIRSNVLRLHVIANSDSREDQSLKLKVRDAVLKEGSDVFGVSGNVTEAVRLIEEGSQRLTQAAKHTLEQNGCSAPVNISICKDRFPTCSYGRYTLPAGEYTAVRVVIGEGSGHNWWCVMFPPLCLPAAEKQVNTHELLNEDGRRVISENPRYEVRFKIVEWFEGIRGDGKIGKN